MRHLVFIAANDFSVPAVLIDGVIYASINDTLQKDEPEMYEKLMVAIAGIPSMQDEGENASLRISLGNKLKAYNENLITLNEASEQIKKGIAANKAGLKNEGLSPTERAQIEHALSVGKNQTNDNKKKIAEVSAEIERLEYSLKQIPPAEVVIDLSKL